MKYEIRYFSKGGNTKKVAEAIAKEINVLAMDISNDIKEDCDVLFLGAAVYAFEIAPEMKNFINSLKNVKKVAIFSTSAIFSKSVYKKMVKLLKKKGIFCFDKYYYSKGEYQIFNIGKPDESDLLRAKEFAREIIEKNI